MANPHQGPPPGPHPGPNLPTHSIDLSDSTFSSDGQAQQPQVADLTPFLGSLSSAFNHHLLYTAVLGYTVNFISRLPEGYVLELRVRHGGQTNATDAYVHGHPSGRIFRSVRDFARHVYHIMRNDLVNCDCSLC